jgi:hypothetical protein
VDDGDGGLDGVGRAEQDKAEDIESTASVWVSQDWRWRWRMGLLCVSLVF